MAKSRSTELFFVPSPSDVATEGRHFFEKPLLVAPAAQEIYPLMEIAQCLARMQSHARLMGGIDAIQYCKNLARRDAPALRFEETRTVIRVSVQSR